MPEDIKRRLGGLSQHWDELRQLAEERGLKLEGSLAYQQFVANVEEEEAWITEKQHLLSGDDIGDTLAAVQVCKKKKKIIGVSFQETRCNRNFFYETYIMNKHYLVLNYRTCFLPFLGPAEKA